MSLSTVNTNAINRIQKLLDYIHHNLESPLSVDEISQKSCWSRWQLQRVFQQHTGMTVASYVRALKLSLAAEKLIHSRERSLDIAIDVGFTSEIAFSRAFKQMFSISPREYRKRQQLTGLRQPLSAKRSSTSSHRSGQFIEVKVETKPSFHLAGIHQPIRGLLSPTPDFHQKVPSIWNTLVSKGIDAPHSSLGVIDVVNSNYNAGLLEYWAGFELSEGANNDQLGKLHLDTLVVPHQTYAVITHVGKVSELANTLTWFILEWLPNSNYRGVDGYELEVYPSNYKLNDDCAKMHYWLPIKSLQCSGKS
ncbi:AraC family transcriptional regulator [Vibrio mytili]|uniref:AraC family transcriptional regulator n=1 Tax=Vibrio mytili TaxID=50718 RepID=UPI002F426E07